ncbi:MAG: formate dehydrogenase subunit alpha, partial [Armatimonadetes bacterium CG07_land_8_20_14_0_80_40_9]
FREMLREARRGRLKALYILGEDPLKNKKAFDGVERALSSLKFLVVQDLFLSRTAEEYAHLVLPAASFAETEGTFTNNVRRVQLLSPAISPLSGKENWQIFSLIAEKMGYPFNYSSAEEIMKEFAALSPLFGGISFERLREKGLQWPCPDKEHPGTKILYKERFMRPQGRAKFNLLKVKPKLSKVKYYDLLEDWFRRG